MSRFLRRKEVLARYGVSNSTLYRWIDEGLFPAPVKLTSGGRSAACGWPVEELEARDRKLLEQRPT